MYSLHCQKVGAVSENTTVNLKKRIKNDGVMIKIHGLLGRPKYIISNIRSASLGGRRNSAAMEVAVVVWRLSSESRTKMLLEETKAHLVHYKALMMVRAVQSHC